MYKLRKRISIFIFIILIFTFCICCFRKQDRMSIEISKQIKGDILYYIGKDTKTYPGVTIYQYLALKEADSEWLHAMVQAVNDALQENKENGKEELVIIRVEVEVSSGARESVFSLANFTYPYYTDMEHERYEGLQALVIQGTHVCQADSFQELDFYTKLEDIRQLRVSQSIQEKATKEGLDWSEVWPGVTVIESY